MAKKRDYYELLGVPRNANEKELKIAYKKLAGKYHPDKTGSNKAAEEKFKETKEAYEILSDPHKRAAYDQFGHAGVEANMGAGGSSRGFNFNDVFGGMGDVFGDIFGGRSSGAQRKRGTDLRYTLELDLEAAIHGTTVEIRIPRLSTCKSCAGTGAKKGTEPIICKTCGGEGQVRTHQGFLSIQRTCPDCHGQGQMVKDPCPDCHGQGQIQETKTLSVTIPAGIDEGNRIRLTGEGEAGLGGASPGDLYVQIHLRPHALFRREGQNLYCDIPIRFTLAMLGGEIEIPTLTGAVKLHIPAETQSGKILRLRGKGVPGRPGGTGDLLCRVFVETPINLNSKQKELACSLEKELGMGTHYPKARQWFENVRRFFTKQN